MAQDVLLPSLAGWDSFYVITGSAAAALTGLQFVVMALVADARAESSTETIGAFGTPNIVHFCMVLLISAMLDAPWRSLSSVAIALAVCGAGGVTYALLVTRRAQRQTGYKPVAEDWIWHSVLPLTAYVAMLIAALALTRHGRGAMFAIAAAVLLLLFIAIHNTWDTIIYIALERPKRN